MNPSAPLEIEIKYHLERPEPVRDRILALGGTTLGRYFETNIRFEDKAHQLIKNRCLLRLRKDRKTTLTYKSKPLNADPEFKVFQELEVEIDDFTTMRRLLESIGFHKEQMYEKWRETFRIGDATLCIDEMPFGVFLEIEGRRSDIRKWVDRLGFRWERRILFNYLALFEILRSRCGLPFTDVTFDNFKDIRLDFRSFRHLFEAGIS